MAPASKKPVIAIAGLAIETSTFSPARSEASAFRPVRGPAILQQNAFLLPGTFLGDAITWHGILTGHALPGGVVTAEAFEALVAEIEAGLRRLTDVDGVWLDIHGAMVVEHIEDAELTLLRRVRAALCHAGGANILVSASLDLHGNVSRELAHECDLVTCYRTAPHVDVVETRQRACQNLVDVLAASAAASRIKRPLKAWIPIPILLPGEQTSTRDEPAKSLYASVGPAARAPGVLDASVWVGYAWADEARCRASVVVTGWDISAVSQAAETLAACFWRVRGKFRFVAPSGTLAECLAAALSSLPAQRPFFVSDTGDNPTAGGSGDVTWTLARILANSAFGTPSGPTLIYASIPAGPRAMQTALAAGPGATITLTAGAAVDNTHAAPLSLTGTIHALRTGDRAAQIEAVLRIGSVLVILTQLRKAYHLERDFLDLDLHPREADIVVVKIGYLEPELYAMCKGWMLALTPGGVDQDLKRLGHRRIRRPMWPFDQHFEHEPDLSARLIAPSHEPMRGPDE